MESLLIVLVVIFVGIVVVGAGLGVGIYFIVKAAKKSGRGDVPPRV